MLSAMKLRFFSSIVSIFMVSAFAAVADNHVLQAQSSTVHNNILYYGDDVPEAWLDVYLPGGLDAPYPTVVYVTPPANTNEGLLSYYTPHLTEQGYAAVAIRIRPQHISPDSFCGLAWVHANATEYGFDTDRIAAFGISGSGIPTALFGTIDRDVENPFMENCPHPEPEGPWVSGVVTYEALFLTPVGLDQELVRSDATRFSGLPREELDTLLDLLIQTPPDEWDVIAEADPEHRWFIQSFPLYWLDGSEPPFLLIYGNASERGWMADEQQFFASHLESVGGSVEIVEKQGLRHSVNALAGRTEEMDAFLRAIFGSTASLPAVLIPITPDNVDQIEELAAYEQTAVCTAAFSSDGAVLASSGNATVALWDTANLELINTLAAGYRSVSSLAFNSDSTLLAAASTENCGRTHVTMWDVTTGAMKLQLLNDFEHMTTGVAFSPDGTMLAVGTGCVFNVLGSASVKLWDVASGVLLKDFEASSFVMDVAFSPDGTLLAATVGDEIRLWEVATGAVYTVFSGHAGGVSSLSFSPDGKQLASTSWEEDAVRMWDVVTGEQFNLLEGHIAGGNDVTFSPDGRLIVVSGGTHTVEFWDAETGESLAVREAGTRGDFVVSVAFNAGNTLLATCGHDQMLRLWGVPPQS